jgi:glycosyltransferase involved in cell wall biosynthesis
VLRSLQGLDCEIFLVDSGSADRTVRVAEATGARIVTHPFESQARARQLNWALDTLPLAAAWTLRLDADERLTDDLAAEIARVIGGSPDEIVGYLIIFTESEKWVEWRSVNI